MMTQKAIDERLQTLINKYCSLALGQIKGCEKSHGLSDTKSRTLGYGDAVKSITSELLSLRVAMREE